MFDVLRASTTMVAALAAGVKEIRIFEEIEQAPMLPRLFNDDVLEGTKELVEAARKDGASVTLGSDHKNKVTLTDNAVRHAAFLAFADIFTETRRRL